ncbi:hypothetical protein HDU97_010018 [Phlyctochytrium planicorne]|nr:hypothetical protein HDU97_010018 [Phlyctochytrium planicorne]
MSTRLEIKFIILIIALALLVLFGLIKCVLVVCCGAKDDEEDQQDAEKGEIAVVPVPAAGVAPNAVPQMEEKPKQYV